MFYVVYINGKWYFVGKDSLAHSLALTKFCLAHISTTIETIENVQNVQGDEMILHNSMSDLWLWFLPLSFEGAT